MAFNPSTAGGQSLLGRYGDAYRLIRGALGAVPELNFAPDNGSVWAPNQLFPDDLYTRAKIAIPAVRKGCPSDQSLLRRYAATAFPSALRRGVGRGFGCSPNTIFACSSVRSNSAALGFRPRDLIS